MIKIEMLIVIKMLIETNFKMELLINILYIKILHLFQAYEINYIS